MKRYLTHLPFSLFTVAAFYNAVHAQKEKMDEGSIAGTWKLVPTLPSDTATGRLAIIQFNTANGSFVGNTGCNSISGKFSINGNMLQFKEQAVDTKNDCQGFNEEVFLANLLKVNHYKIEDGVLNLMVNQTALFKWMRKDTPANIKTR